MKGFGPAKKADKIVENFRNLTIVAGDLIQTPPGEIEADVRLADKTAETNKCYSHFLRADDW